MSCAEYWASQGIDPIDAAMSVGCHPMTDGGGHDVIGGAMFLLLLALAAVVSCRSEPVDDGYDPFR